MSNVETMPSAHITVNKGRKKIKDDKYVYLNNGQEFEIELFNPTTDNLLVKIWINNKQMSSTGVVLRPGDRVFLERYIDIPKKFLFDTYEVNGGNSSVQKAIEKNGLVKIQFFREDSPIYYNPNYLDYLDNTWTTGPFGGNTSGNFSDSKFFTSSNTTMMTTSSIGGQSVRGTNIPKNTRSKSLKKRGKIETGRVEQGSHSSQTFTTVNMKFLSWPMRTIEYQIKPTSTQPQSITQVLTKYCTGCGKKAKPANKFCSNCGTKL